MLRFITLLLFCQLVGETLRFTFDLPVPGPVIGMVILFVGLLVKGNVPRDLQQTGDGILQHLSLLFVPAGVGVIVHIELLADEWDAIAVSLIASTIAAVAVTGLCMRWLGSGNDNAGES